MTLYGYIPLTSLNDPEQVSTDLDGIKRKVADLTSKYSQINDGFAVVEVRVVGIFEKVEPIWIPASDIPQPPKTNP